MACLFMIGFQGAWHEGEISLSSICREGRQSMEGVVPDDLDILLGFNKYLVQAHRCWGPVSVKKEACAHSCQQHDTPTGLMCSCRT